MAFSSSHCCVEVARYLADTNRRSIKVEAGTSKTAAPTSTRLSFLFRYPVAEMNVTVKRLCLAVTIMMAALIFVNRPGAELMEGSCTLMGRRLELFYSKPDLPSFCSGVRRPDHPSRQCRPNDRKRPSVSSAKTEIGLALF